MSVVRDQWFSARGKMDMLAYNAIVHGVGAVPPLRKIPGMMIVLASTAVSDRTAGNGFSSEITLTD